MNLHSYHSGYFLSHLSIDWSMIAALAALITCGILVWQTRYSTSTQTLNQLLASWQSSPLFPDFRRRAATMLLKRLEEQTIPLSIRPAGAIAVSNQARFDLDIVGIVDDSYPIDAVLDFFDTVAFYSKKGVLDFKGVLSLEQIHQAFFWDMSCYWVVIQKYIADLQEDEGLKTWKNYRDIMPRLLELEGRDPTVADVRAFLYGERSLTR